MKKTHRYAGFVWGVFFITIRNSDTVSVYDHPFLPPWDGWFAQTLITRLGHPQMGKKQMVPTFPGKNNSIFDGRKPYLTEWDLEKCNEWDNKNSIKCNKDKSNVLYQERKTPCVSTGLGTTTWGRSWGLRWVNTLLSPEKNVILGWIQLVGEVDIPLFLALPRLHPEHPPKRGEQREGRAQGHQDAPGPEHKFCKVRRGELLGFIW